MQPLHKEQLLERVRLRMSQEHLDQRALAERLQMTQGHLSKLLRGRFARRSRLVRELEAFASGLGNTRARSQLVGACLRVASRSQRHMHFATTVMHFVDEISTPPTANRRHGPPRKVRRSKS